MSKQKLKKKHGLKEFILSAMDYLTDLPDELIMMISEKLDSKSIGNLCLTAKKFAHIFCGEKGEMTRKSFINMVQHNDDLLKVSLSKELTLLRKRQLIIENELVYGKGYVLATVFRHIDSKIHYTYKKTLTTPSYLNNLSYDKVCLFKNSLDVLHRATIELEQLGYKRILFKDLSNDKRILYKKCGITRVFKRTHREY